EIVSPFPKQPRCRKGKASTTPDFPLPETPRGDHPFRSWPDRRSVLYNAAGDSCRSTHPSIHATTDPSNEPNLKNSSECRSRDRYHDEIPLKSEKSDSRFAAGALKVYTRGRQ